MGSAGNAEGVENRMKEPVHEKGPEFCVNPPNTQPLLMASREKYLEMPCAL